MEHTFADNFRQCCDESAGCGVWAKIQEDPDYWQAKQAYDALRQTLVERLGD